jgi:hypothetical protein
VTDVEGIEWVLYEGVRTSGTPMYAAERNFARVLGLKYGGGVSQVCRVRTGTGAIEGTDGGVAVRVWCGVMRNVTSVELVEYLKNLTRDGGAGSGGEREGAGIEGTTRQGVGGEGSGLLVLCPQTDAEGQRKC